MSRSASGRRREDRPGCGPWPCPRREGRSASWPWRGCRPHEADRALLRTFANHAALALERAQLREQALRSELLEEVDHLRHALMGAVSHDLRTPLATMKVASSTLLHPAYPLSDADMDELHGLIDVETDRLTRLVTSLLDMTRIDAGVLEVRRGPTSVAALVSETVNALHSTLGDRPGRWSRCPTTCPMSTSTAS